MFGHRALWLRAIVAWSLVSAGCGARRPEPDIIDERYRGFVDSDDVERGLDRYEIVCAPCHGDHRDRQGPLLAGLGWSPAEIRHQVREGSALMPPIRATRLSDADLEAMLAYFLTIGTAVEEAEEIDEHYFDDEAADAGVDAGRDAPGLGEPLPRREDDAGVADAEASDAGLSDAPWDATDASRVDGRDDDAGAESLDPSAGDAAAPDAGVEPGLRDGGAHDASGLDAGARDAPARDASVRDAPAIDGGVMDGGVVDDGARDGGAGDDAARRGDTGVVEGGGRGAAALGAGRALATPRTDPGRGAGAPH